MENKYALKQDTFLKIFFFKYKFFHPKNDKNQHFCFPVSQLMYIFYILDYTMSADCTSPYLNLMFNTFKSIFKSSFNLLICHLKIQ